MLAVVCTPIRYLLDVLGRDVMYRKLPELELVWLGTVEEFCSSFGPGGPGSAVALATVETFGNFPNRFHPSVLILCTDGAFHREAVFVVAPEFNRKDLETIFRHKVLKMLLAKGKITQELILKMDG